MVGPISGWKVILLVPLSSLNRHCWFLLCFAIAGIMLVDLGFGLFLRIFSVKVTFVLTG